MKITVINGTTKHGVTYRLKEMFLEPFKKQAAITEYYLPKDCPAFCSGCVNCIIKGEHTCKDAGYIQKIEESLLEADLIVMTSPCYVMHTTGAMKSLLDHFAYRFMSHRPAPCMFTKRAVIITQCLGAGAKSTAKDIKHSLSWWGITKIGIFQGALMEDCVWERLSESRRRKLTNKIQKLSEKFAGIDYTRPARVGIIVKVKFCFCRMIQKSVYQTHPEGLDCNYWSEQGWLLKARPWKESKFEKEIII